MAIQYKIYIQIEKLFNTKLRQPTTKQNLLWQEEFKTSGAQFRMSYQQFRNIKLKEYYNKKHQERLAKAQALRDQLKIESITPAS